MRHRVSIRDFSILLAVLLVATFFAFEVDIYENEETVSRRELTLELDEVLSLGGLLCLGLLILTIRRYREQKRETVRRMAAERHARELAFCDPLTGLANRRRFDDALKAALAAPPGAESVHALFVLDLNGFKQVNDVHGHGVGDELLGIVAQRLASAIREGDLVARLGGDEFAILAHHLIGAEAAANIALRVLQALEEPISTKDNLHRVGAGIGITLLPGDALTPQEALRKADVALYRAKAERRSALRFFEKEMDRLVRERDELERELRAAVADNTICPIYQPLVHLQTRKVVGFEVIPRWQHPSFGQVSPERFLSVAEDTGLIHELSAQLLRKACQTAAGWPEEVTLAFDIFPSQLKDCLLKTRILSILEESGIAPERLEIEITESALVRDLEAAQEVLGSLRAAGVRIALDNFGTGYSSLYHLRNFKLDKIKIDRGFIQSLGEQQDSAEIVRALVGLGHGLGLTVTAEGVVDGEQQASLLQTGCEEGQGFLFGCAVEAEDTQQFFWHVIDQEGQGSHSCRNAWAIK